MLPKLLPAKWKITDQMELINLQLKNCHKPNNILNSSARHGYGEKKRSENFKASKTFITVTEADGHYGAG